MGSIQDLLAGLFGAGTEAALMNDAIQAAEQTGANALTISQNVASGITEDAQFQPYTITSGTGQVDALGQDGRFAGLTANLSPEQQALVNTLQTVARDNALVAGQDTAARTAGLMSQLGLAGAATQPRSEQEIFDLLNAVQQPEQERERIALENRLFAQGRSGVRTSQFGGTPEELAIAKAREEARSGTAVNAFNLARADEERRVNQVSSMFGQALQERSLGGDLASGLLQSSFIPMDDLRRTATLGADLGSIDQQARTANAQIAAGLIESGLEGSINAQQQATQARIARNQSLANLLVGTRNEEGNVIGGLFNQIADWF